jgi:drug/metabolite transporter (DMT)-like permease
MKLRDWLIFSTLGLAWGSSFLWIKIAVREVGPFTLVGLRLLLGILGLLIIAAYHRPTWPQTINLWGTLFVIGITNTALPFVLVSWGEIYVDSAIASILMSSVPLFTMVISHLFLSDDRMTRSRLTGLLTGFGGVIILLTRDLGGEVQINLIAQGALLLAALLYAVSSVFTRRNVRGVSPVVQALIPLMAADAAIWLAAPFFESPLSLPDLPLTWLAIIWLGLVGSCLAYVMYFYLLHSIGPTRTTLVTYVFPVVGVALGVIFLGERMDWNLLVGGGMIVGGIAVVNSRT